MAFYNWRGVKTAWGGVFGHTCLGAASPLGYGRGSSVISWLRTGEQCHLMVWTQILEWCCLDSDRGSFIYCPCDLGFYLAPWYLSFLIYNNGEKYVTWTVKGFDNFLHTKCLEQCPAQRKQLQILVHVGSSPCSATPSKPGSLVSQSNTDREKSTEFGARGFQFYGLSQVN